LDTSGQSPKVRYVADVSHVRETSLLGTADAPYWRQRLRGEALAPAECDGNAQILIVAADMKFMGLRFQELSVSVLVRRHEGGDATEGSFLLRAFNSRRLFAFCERFFFSTPYYFGDVSVSTFPPSMQLSGGGEALFRAEMRTDGGAPRWPSRSGEGGWAGPVYLPGAENDKAQQGKWFFAKLGGETRAYPYLSGEDLVTIRPTEEDGVLRALSDSHFAGKEWIVREDARHAKSKTYRRSEMASRTPAYVDLGGQAGRIVTGGQP
jgi:hypothetical protein